MLDASEITALLSCFVFQEKSENEITILKI